MYVAITQGVQDKKLAKKMRHSRPIPQWVFLVVSLSIIFVDSSIFTVNLIDSKHDCCHFTLLYVSVRDLGIGPSYDQF